MKHTHLSLFPGQILPTHKAARHKFIIKIMCFIAGSENTQKIKSKTANVLGHVKNGIFHCRKAALIVKKKGGGAVSPSSSSSLLHTSTRAVC